MEIPEIRRGTFRKALLDWFDAQKRVLPWRDATDPYRIWLSEVMLQQTRVDQALPYYTRFLEAFPTVEALAAADLNSVLLHWEGLGYYARARNLHRAAKIVVSKHAGRLPPDYHALRALPGIGAYTAGAIASIAFGLPCPAVDGNARRVLSRYFALPTAGAAALRRMASQLLEPARSGDFNQALMELGATVCIPHAPRCPSCPVRDGCLAREQGNPAHYPAKRPRAPIPHHDIAAAVVIDKAGRLLIQRRADEALLGGLWELPGGKRKENETLPEACRRELKEELGITVAVGALFMSVKHAYSHFRITLHAFRCTITDGTPVSAMQLPLRWVPLGSLGKYAFPRANRRILDALAAAPAEDSATLQAPGDTSDSKHCTAKGGRNG